MSRSGADAAEAGGGAQAERGQDPLEAEPLALVIEDDEDAAAIAAGMLQLLGYRTVVAGDGHDALVALNEELPDLILLDINLPLMDGVNLLKVARRQSDVRGVPVVAVSALYPRESRVRDILRRSGVTEFLSKPFSLHGLREAVTSAVTAAGTARPEVTAKLWADNEALRATVESASPSELVVVARDGDPRLGATLRVLVDHSEEVDGAVVRLALRAIAQVRSTTRLDDQRIRLGLKLLAAEPEEAHARLVRYLGE